MDNLEKALKAAEKAAGYVITLSTGTLVLSATFFENVIPDGPRYVGLVLASWILLTIAILFGLITFMSFVYKYKTGECDPYDRYTSIPAGISFSTFFAGVVLFWIFVWINVVDC